MFFSPDGVAGSEQREKLSAAFGESISLVIEHIGGVLGDSHTERFMDFFEGIGTNGIQTFWGTKRYDQDMEAAGNNSMNRPFGIEIDTLSPNVQTVLYPTTIYKPDDELRTIAKEEGYEIREGGTQVMVYFLDGFEEEAINIYDLGANLFFISHMAGAALNTRYPLTTGEKSQEFLQEVRAGLSVVRDYVQALNDEQRTKLSPRIAKIGLLDTEALEAEAKRRVLYHAEPMKMPGLYEPEREDMVQQTPEQAVQNGTPYLHLDERDLPQRVEKKGKKDMPSLPWVEYGKNRWNRSHQLFGRYEAKTGEEFLLVDFRLDSTHFPLMYGFFDTIEVIERTPDGIKQHVVLGQEVGESLGVFPIIVGGDFDFTQPDTRSNLNLLAQDRGTKREVARVLADVLKFSAEGRLQRVQQV